MISRIFECSLVPQPRVMERPWLTVRSRAMTSQSSREKKKKMSRKIALYAGHRPTLASCLESRSFVMIETSDAKSNFVYSTPTSFVRYFLTRSPLSEITRTSPVRRYSFACESLKINCQRFAIVTRTVFFIRPCIELRFRR